MIRYSRRSPIVWFRFLSTDLFCILLSLIFPPRGISGNFNKILIANPGHLGDLVIASYLTSYLKKIYPDLQIDFLCGSWGNDLMSGNQDVTSIFNIDFPILNRSNISRVRKYIIFISNLKKLFTNLKSQHYDCIFSIYSFSPSCIPLLWCLRTSPVIGYNSACYGPLLSHQYSAFNIGHIYHELDYQIKIFDKFFVQPDLFELNSSLDFSSIQLRINNTLSGIFIVIHPGAGRHEKEWSIDGWNYIIHELAVLRNIQIVITGYGSKDLNLANQLISHQNVINLTNQLSFQEFSKVVSLSKIVIGVDSVACHLAAALSVKSISILKNSSSFDRWKPLGKKNHVVFVDDISLNVIFAQKVVDDALAYLSDANN